MVTDHVMRRRIYIREYMREYRGQKRRPVPVEAFQAEYAAGRSLREIGAAHQFDEKTVRVRLKKLGVEMRPRGGKRTTSFVLGVFSRGRVDARGPRGVKRRPVPLDVFRAEYAAGRSPRQIGFAHDFDESTVRKHLKRAGVAMRGRWGKEGARPCR